MIELLAAIIPYTALGSGIRVVWGTYKAYTSFLSIRINWARIWVEFAVGILFGVFGGIFLSQLGIFTMGINLVSLVSSILGANIIDVIAKKFGFSRKMEVVVSDQQLGFTELNQRQVNAMEYVRAQGRITNAAYQKINRTTCDVAKYELRSLVEKKKLKMVGEKKGAVYVSA